MSEQGIRTHCLGCGRSRALYCEECLLALEQPAPEQLRLPCKIDIVQHGEISRRSTSLAAAVLAPQDVAVHRHPLGASRPCMLDLPLPNYDPATTVVLFPDGPDTDVVGRCARFERLVVLESNWKKATGLLRHPRLQGLRRVQLPPGLQSEYVWRRGDGSFRRAVEGGLSSIEAIYHCCRLLGGPGYSYEGLLRYFLHTKEQVEASGKPLPTSRQEARARIKQQRADARAAAAALAEAGAAGAAADARASPSAAGEVRPRVPAVVAAAEVTGAAAEVTGEAATAAAASAAPVHEQLSQETDCAGAAQLAQLEISS